MNEQVALKDKQPCRTYGWEKACQYQLFCCPEEKNKHRQAWSVTVMLETTPLCRPPLLLWVVGTWGWQAVTTSRRWSEMTISVHSEASEMMTQRDKVSWIMITPSQCFSLWRTMEDLFWPLVFTLSLGCDRAGVSGQHMASSDWKQIGLVLITPALSAWKCCSEWNLSEERCWQHIKFLIPFLLKLMLSQPLLLLFSNSALLLKARISLQWCPL